MIKLFGGKINNKTNKSSLRAKRLFCPSAFAHPVWSTGLRLKRNLRSRAFSLRCKSDPNISDCCLVESFVPRWITTYDLNLFHTFKTVAPGKDTVRAPFRRTLPTIESPMTSVFAYLVSIPVEWHWVMHNVSGSMCVKGEQHGNLLCQAFIAKVNTSKAFLLLSKTYSLPHWHHGAKK